MLKFSKTVKYLLALMVSSLFSLLLLFPAQAASSWATPVNLSSVMNDAWFPDISTDSSGKLHIIYSGNDPISEKSSPLWEKYDRLYYQQAAADGAVLAGGPYNIAISPFGVVMRNSMTVDSKLGLAHVLFRSKGSLYYQNAPLDKATTPIAWSEPRNIDDLSGSYYSDIAVDEKGVTHIIWTTVKTKDEKKIEDPTNFRQVVMYRNSSNNGQSWSYPKEIAEPKLGATRPVLHIDQGGGLHVSWDDGYDNYVANGYTATYGAYIHSLDGGKTWNDSAYFGSPQEPVVQTAMTTFGENGVMITWRVIKTQRIDYAVSNDRGVSWSNPATIPGSTTRFLTAQHYFDRNDMMADAKGRVHLANVGLVDPSKRGKTTGEKAEDLALFHTVWQDGKWLAPEAIVSGQDFPEYPRLAIGPDRLHIVYFARNKAVDEGAKSVWYTSRPFDTGVKSETAASYVPPAPTAVIKSVATPAPTPLAILPPINNQPTRSWFDDGYKAALFSLGPVLVIGGLMLGISFWRRRKNKV